MYTRNTNCAKDNSPMNSLACAIAFKAIRLAMQSQTTVDHAAIKTGQLLSIALMLAALVTGRWQLIAALAAVFLITAIAYPLGPFVLTYRLLLKPLAIVSPDLRVDNLQPHLFGQAVGAASAAVAALALYMGHSYAGWALVWLLIVLTAISFKGWCIGCFLYYQLNRLGLRGFFAKKPTDNQVPLGARPRK